MQWLLHSCPQIHSHTILPFTFTWKKWRPVSALYFHSHFHSISVSDSFPLSPYFAFLLPIQSFAGSFFLLFNVTPPGMKVTAIRLFWKKGKRGTRKKSAACFFTAQWKLVKEVLSRKLCGAESQQGVCHVRSASVACSQGVLCVCLFAMCCVDAWRYSGTGPAGGCVSLSSLSLSSPTKRPVAFGEPCSNPKPCLCGIKGDAPLHPELLIPYLWATQRP